MRAKGGDEPVVVMAYGDKQDFSFTDLRRSSFDLTDRGVGGREVPGPIDAFLYTERGVYRPGETVYLTAMLRDRIGAAATAPLTLVATRPDGLEVGRMTVPGAALKAGTATWTLPLSSSAPHGRWQIAAYIDTSKDAEPVGRVQFDVQDFVPQKLKVALTVETKTVKPNSEIKVRADSRFLYGAPASGLTGEGVARISTDFTPFDNYTGWQFGRVDDSFSDVDVQMNVPTTDAGGSTEVTGMIGDLTDTTLPLKAMVKVSIHEPGGRVTAKTVEIPVRNHDIMIGLRPQFGGGSVAEGARAGFEAVALDSDGKRIALNGVTYSWVREDTSYQWYEDNGGWKYKSVTRDRLITSGTMSIGAGAPANLAQAMAWGTYRLTLTDPQIGRLQFLSLLFRLGGIECRRPARPHPGRGRQARLSRGRDRACAHQADGGRQGAGGGGLRQGVLLASGRCAGGRRDRRYSRVGRLGRGRLCAGDGLSPARPGDGA